MKHGVKIRKFGREKSVREALMRSLMRSLILHERIETSLARAKSLRPMVEKLVTKAKKDSVENRRLISSKFGGEAITVRKTFELAKRFDNRPGGYTRIIKTGHRDSDASDRAVIEFVEELPSEPKDSKEETK
jgi:large subunit ribosomal protein L17